MDAFVTENLPKLAALEQEADNVKALLQQPAGHAADPALTYRRRNALEEKKHKADLKVIHARAEIDDTETEYTHRSRHMNMQTGKGRHDSSLRGTRLSKVAKIQAGAETTA